MSFTFMIKNATPKRSGLICIVQGSRLSTEAQNQPERLKCAVPQNEIYNPHRIGEVFVPKGSEGPRTGNPFGKAVHAVSNEIAALIEDMDLQTAKTLLKAILWAGIMSELERVEAAKNKAN